MLDRGTTRIYSAVLQFAAQLIFILLFHKKNAIVHPLLYYFICNVTRQNNTSDSKGHFLKTNKKKKDTWTASACLCRENTLREVLYE